MNNNLIIIGLFLLLILVSCSDSVKTKIEYRLDRAGNPEYKEFEYQYTIKEDKYGNEIEIKNGLSKEFYSNGQPKSEINYVNGKINGHIKTFFEDGKIAEISSWTNDERDGSAKYYYESGTIYQEENYKNGNLEGEQKTYYENGKLRTQIIFKDNLLWQVLYNYDSIGNKLDQLTIDKGVGILNIYYPSGQIFYKIDYVDGKPNGKLKVFYESGKEQGYITFQDGIKNGILKMYHENGKIAREAIYKNDYLIGIERIYNEKGILISENNYKQNLAFEDIEKLSSGIFSLISSSIDPFGLGYGIKHGSCKTYHSNGKLSSEEYFFNGEQDSLFREYYENGYLKTDIYIDPDFEYNKRYEIKFDENGKIVESIKYEPRNKLAEMEKELKEILESKTDVK